MLDMKIVSIVREQTKSGSVAFKTDPPLTNEIFSLFKDHVTDTSFASNDGLLLIDRMVIQEDHIDQYNKVLTESEHTIRRQKAETAKEREDFLQALSKSSGVPLE
jgi:hypothetical protein